MPERTLVGRGAASRKVGLRDPLLAAVIIKMIATTEEQERPYEWIQRIVEGGEYRSLLDEAGDIAFAAYRLARALCRIRPIPTSVPTLRELIAAAAEIGSACGIRVPSGTSLAEACENEGLLVIEPMHGRWLQARLAR